MNRRLRLVATGAIVGVMALIATASPAAAFTDVKTSHPFYTEITWASNNDIVNGYPDDTFRGGNQVTRQASAAFLYRFAAAPGYVPPANASFSDVPTSYVFFKEIEWMVAAELTTGYNDDTFRPGAPVTRQAMAAFLYRTAGSPSFTGTPSQTFNDVPTNHPFWKAIEFVWDFYIADGYYTPYGLIFKPGGIVSRQATAAFLYRFDQVASSSSAADRSATPQSEWGDPATASPLLDVG